MAISPDNPIRDVSQDSLGRSGVADSFSRQVLALDASEGFVIGILGKWGTGKTSFLNLMRPTLQNAGVQIVDFNPWMFSGVEQLADAFFNELSAQLKVRPGFSDVASAIEEYGETFSDVARLPVIGPWYGLGLGVAKAINKIVKRRKGGVQPVRLKVKDALASLTKPIAVIVDDVDRLSTGEIRDLFKLVRLTANFPNLIYLVAFDRQRVESALEEQGVRGRDYLEKILQMAIDLPFTPEDVLQKQVLQLIEGALKDVSVDTHFDESTWPNIFFEIIRPLIRNMRDVRRYTTSLRWVVESLDGRISLGDVLALEAVRVFLPDVFYKLPSYSSTLTSNNSERKKYVSEVETFLEVAGEKKAVVESLIRRLFPAAASHVGGSGYGPEWDKIWLKKKRVANIDLLRFYLERFAGESLAAFSRAEHAWSVIADEEKLGNLFEDTPPSERESLIQSLEAFEDEFRREHVVPAVTVLLNTLPTIPYRQRGFLEFDAEMTVGRVVYRLVRALRDADAVMEAVSQIIPKVTQLTQKIQLINMVGDREGAGHNLVSKEQARQLESAWRGELRAAASDALAQEMDLLRVFYEEMHQGPNDTERTPIPPDPEVTYAMLRSARSETKVQSGDSAYIERRPRLAWDVLTKVYGGEEVLLDRISGLKASTVVVDEELAALADKYVEGWRPSERDDD